MTAPIDRAQLTALRDVIDSLLSAPDHTLALLVGFLRPPAAAGNGVDPNPPGGRRRHVHAKAGQGRRAAAAKAAESALMAALKDNPDQGPAMLAKLTGSRTSTTSKGCSAYNPAVW